MFQKTLLTIALLLALTSCASPTKWNISGESEINFINGKIIASTQISKEKLNQFEFLTFELKITNTSAKQIEIDPSDVIALTADGRVINHMSRDELLTLSKSKSNYATSVGVGLGHYNHFGTSIVQNREAENSLMEFFDGNSLKKGIIPANAFKQGLLFFAIPKNNSDEVTFKFENSLASDQQISIQKQK